jgi:predicted amidohydrolase YtcJ
VSPIDRATFLRRSAALSTALGLGYLPGVDEATGAEASGAPGVTGTPGSPPRSAGGDVHADLVLRNGRVYTVDGVLPRAEAFAVRSGRFLAVGSNDDVANLVGPDTRVIDAGGMTVTPGFIDAHSHPAAGGLNELTSVNASVPSIAELKEALRRRAAGTARDEWITGFLYDDTKMSEGRAITRWDLDEAVPDHPVSITHRSGHATYYNTRALEMAGLLGREVADPEGGRFGRNERGELDGMTAGSARQAFSGLGTFRPVTRRDRQEGVRLITARMAASGLTSVHDAGAGPEAIAAYHDARQAGELSVRMYAMVRGGYAALKAAGVRTGFGDEWVRIGPVKYTADGAAASRTMAMSTPYVGRPEDYGILYMSEEEIQDAVDDAHANHFRITIHANGDVPITRVLNAYERALRREPRPDHRWRIEHCSLVNPEILRRIRELGVIPAPFYTYVYWHGDKFHEYGEERMRWMFAHRSFLDHGIPVAPASDYVPGPFEPMMALQSMVTRTDFLGNVWGPNQRVSVEEAIRICTMNGAYASFEENEKGSITAGKLADFVILGRDPHEVDPFALKDIPVVRTVVGGRTVHGE